ncbi:metal-sulfur cluster assembly factor [Fundicoccus culcitae]|uniref:Metal-sulfur cluster assembly factor n=1 Tax=Fundicoccus culcitae TaxID=2969821 RepID=A0ABY5P6A8_9LACT|nr:metal-sulfur cluster assembly factor [Fundicoccus culcitae]UUX34111.1 metal-sulfur cluster assembly factor [Fundicoccus culcitae]
MNNVYENGALQELVYEALEKVIDPELGIDIVNLGLVYNVVITEDAVCKIEMTLTSMGCPLIDVIDADINREVKKITEIKDVEIELVWYPAWTPEKMSRYAKIALGIRA